MRVSLGAPTLSAAATVVALSAAVWCGRILARVAAARLERFIAEVIGIAVCALGVGRGSVPRWPTISRTAASASRKHPAASE